MIWAHVTENDSPEGALASRILSDLHEVCGADSASGIEHIEDVARGVASFLERPGNTAPADSRYTLPLVLRALLSMGAERTARKLAIFGTGAARHAQWSSVGAGPMWIIDVGRIGAPDGPDIEISWFAGIAAAVDAVTDLWDESQGRGALGLGGVWSAACDLLDSTRKSANVRSLVNETKLLCGARLEKARQTRGWLESPRVVCLDT